MRMSVRFMVQALENKPITVFWEGKQTRSFCYIDALIDGLLLFMEKDGLAGEIINLGSDWEHTVQEYAQLIKTIIGSTSEIHHTEPLPEDDPLQRKPDLTKAKNLLGWEPKISLEEGLKKTIE